MDVGLASALGEELVFVIYALPAPAPQLRALVFQLLCRDLASGTNADFHLLDLFEHLYPNSHLQPFVSGKADEGVVVLAFEIGEGGRCALEGERVHFFSFKLASDRWQVAG